MAGIFNSTIEHHPGLLTRDEYERRCALCSSGQVLGLIQSPEYQRWLLKRQESSSSQDKPVVTSSRLSMLITLTISASVIAFVGMSVVLFNGPMLGRLATWQPLKRSGKVDFILDSSMGRKHGRYFEELTAGSRIPSAPGLGGKASAGSGGFTKSCTNMSLLSFRQGLCFDRDEEFTLLWARNQELVAVNERLRKTIDIGQKFLWIMLIPLSLMGLCIVCMSLRRSGVHQRTRTARVRQLAGMVPGGDKSQGNGTFSMLDALPSEFQQVETIAEGAPDAEQRGAEMEQFLALREGIKSLWCLDSENSNLEAYLADRPLDILIETNRKLLEDKMFVDSAAVQETEDRDGEPVGEEERELSDKGSQSGH